MLPPFPTPASLASDGIDAVLLHHPQTGHTVECGPYSMSDYTEQVAAAQREARCIDDYQRQGYARGPQ